MNNKEISKWWQRGMAKEQLRHSNSPKPARGNKWETTMDYSQFAPELKRAKPMKAR